MKQQSLWELPRNDTIKETKKRKFDLIILGGGIAGMTTAYFLKDYPGTIALLEKGRIGHGVSSHSTGKLTYLQGIYHKIEKATNLASAKLYWKSQKEAISLAESIILKEEIKCNYHEVSSYLFASKESEEKTLEQEIKCCEEIGMSFSAVAPHEIVLPFTKAYKVEETAVFHPVKFITGLKECIPNCLFQEGVIAKTLRKTEQGYEIDSNKGVWTAKMVVTTTHYPFFIQPGYIPFKTSIERSYLVSAKTREAKYQSGINVGNEVLSFRYHYDTDEYIMLAGESHLLTHHYDSAKRYEELRKKFQHIVPCPIEYQWMTHDIMSEDSLPMIGKLEPNLYLATAFNKWGMTNGILAGKIISDLILKGSSPYETLVSPTRHLTLHRLLKRMYNGLETSTLYIKTTLVKNHSFYQTAYVIKENGIPYGIYIDEQGKTHKVLNKCPHLRCNLIFNRIDKTWDCPCHGSRFNIDGNLIEGPSTSSISLCPTNKTDPKEKKS